jgi:hypothetical protein
MRHLVVFLVSALFVCAPAGPSTRAFAADATDTKWVLIVVKTLNFVNRKPAPDAKVVVVGNAADLATAQSSLAEMTVTEGKAGDAAGAYAIFVNTADEARAAHAANSAILIIGSNESCVEAGACVLAVETQPKVTIYVSRAAAQAAGIEFDPNFKMMITEK